MKYADISDLMGLTMVSASGREGDEEMVFVTADGRRFVFYHTQDCCEAVTIADVAGDLGDLVDSPLLQAEEVTFSSEDGDVPAEYAAFEQGYESWTWTFYKFATIKGSVTVRWLGESNGYYSEEVSLRVEDAPRERIASAAIRIPAGIVVSVDQPGRHHDCFLSARSHGHFYAEIQGSEQGFVTTHGRFLGRREAFVVAETAGQILHKMGPSDMLFSEDLW